MFANTNVSKPLVSAGPVLQDSATPSFKNPGNDDGVETIEEIEGKTKDKMQCHIDVEKVPDEGVSMELKKGKDDDSTAVISEASSSSSSHLRTDMLSKNTDTFPSLASGEKSNVTKGIHDDLTLVWVTDSKKHSNHKKEEESIGKEAEEKSTFIPEVESGCFIDSKQEMISKQEVAKATQFENTENSIEEEQAKKEGEHSKSWAAISSTTPEDSEPPTQTLAQRMKNMFDSASPDQPSNAFRKSGTLSSVAEMSPKSFLAKEMKQVFESPSSDEPSRAFGVMKANVEISKRRLATAVNLRCKTDEEIQKREQKAGAMQPNTPISVADQMVSLLWASSSSSTKTLRNSQRLEDQEVKTGNIPESDHAVLSESIIEERNKRDSEIEEVTVDDETDHGIAIADNQSFDEIIEEITIVENDYEKNSDVGVAFNDQFCKNEVFIEVKVSPDLVGTVSKGEWDSHSYDEFTTDDWEYDEETIDEEVLKEDEECGKESKKVQEEEGTKPNSLIIPHTISRQKNVKDGRNIRTSKEEKLSPQITRDLLACGKVAQKLIMFDSPKHCSGHSPSMISKQTLENQKSKLMIKSSSHAPKVKSTNHKGANPKIPVALTQRSNHTERFDEEPCKMFGCNEEDEALMDEIVSLMKEPGAMKNKNVLAERIVFLLTGQSKNSLLTTALKPSEKIEPKPSTPNLSSCTASSNNIKYSLSKNNNAVEADLYLNRKKDELIDPGRKQMRRIVKDEKEKLDHVDDPDAIENRRLKQIDIVKPKQEAVTEPTMKHPFEMTQQAVDPEEIMARIWPKAPNGGKSSPKASSFSPRVSKSLAPETQKTTPRKLGSRLTMFESPTLLITPPMSSAKCVESKSTIKSFKQSKKNFQSTKVDATNQVNQINKDTVRRLSTFQKFWRSKKLEQRAVPKAKAVCAASPSSESYSNPGKGSATSISVQSSESVAEVIIAPSTSLKSVASNGGCCYSLEDLEKGNFDRSIIDMERWEEFLTDESFYQHFGITKEHFYEQPRWKRDKQKRKVRVAF